MIKMSKLDILNRFVNRYFKLNGKYNNFKLVFKRKMSTQFIKQTLLSRNEMRFVLYFYLGDWLIELLNISCEEEEKFGREFNSFIFKLYYNDIIDFFNKNLIFEKYGNNIVYAKNYLSKYRFANFKCIETKKEIIDAVISRMIDENKYIALLIETIFDWTLDDKELIDYGVLNMEWFKIIRLSFQK